MTVIRPLNPVQRTGPGRSFPLGPTICEEGTNFSLFSANATMVELLLFNGVDDVAPSRTIEFDTECNRTSHYWHMLVCGITPGQLYGFRVHGPDDPAAGHRFDSQKVLLDPYGRSVAVGKNYSRADGCRPGDTAATCMKSVVVDPNRFDWEDDAPLNHSFQQTVIYEMHVAGFTRNPNSGVAEGKRGTFLGVVEKIPYLQQLGVTAVELLPVFQFDLSGYAPDGLENYWGYDPVSFFAPHLAYCTDSDPSALYGRIQDDGDGPAQSRNRGHP
jgi:isoamylase